jgi:hypothetical protein
MSQSLVYAPFYENYVSRVGDEEVLAVLTEQPQRLREMAHSLGSGGETFRYAAGKWSVREVVGHLIDGERVFGYRALAISRGDDQPLPSFDEKAYIETAGYDRWPLANLLSEFEQLRAAHLAMFRRLDQDAWDRVGHAAGHPVSTRALAYIMAGHVRHHLGVLRERYGRG